MGREVMAKKKICETCEHFYKVYPDLVFGGCHLNVTGEGKSVQPDFACDRWEVRGK